MSSQMNWRADDIPSIVIDHLETPSPLNPLGAKGVGESGTLPVPAAVASAVDDALAADGVWVQRMPLSVREIASLVRAAGACPAHPVVTG